jgi:hypothetical protein
MALHFKIGRVLRNWPYVATLEDFTDLADSHVAWVKFLSWVTHKHLVTSAMQTLI